MLVGIMYVTEEETLFNINGNNGFTNTEEELKDLAVCINSPWSQTDEKYTITYNCKDSYTEKNPNEPNWKCEYEVIGYDMITTVIYGYGDTPQESLQNCIDLFNRLQKEYNKDNDAF
ncbi:MAG: hypothetical protein PHP29_09585 [Tissierellia bacterium]|nr:hypothetical protein [Tissierellia bacterium]